MIALSFVYGACPLRRESQCNNGLHRGLCDYTHIQVYWPELPLPCCLIELICKGKCHPHKALGVMAVPFTPHTTPWGESTTNCPSNWGTWRLENIATTATRKQYFRSHGTLASAYPGQWLSWHTWHGSGSSRFLSPFFWAPRTVSWTAQRTRALFGFLAWP